MQVDALVVPTPEKVSFARVYIYTKALLLVLLLLPAGLFDCKRTSTTCCFSVPIQFKLVCCVFQESIGNIEEGEAVANLGAMGWRLGVPMCKVSRDRHGPKGQWVRDKI